MNYVTGQGTTFGNVDYVDRTKYYRMNYPNLYKTDGLYITKFEKDNRNSMTYQFIGAFPVNIVSMPVSYEASSILKCTASFSYIRYVRIRNRPSAIASLQNPNSPANPDVPVPVNVAPRTNSVANQSSSGDEIVDYSVLQPQRVEAGLPGVGRNNFVERSIFGP
jgi:hypothetical protein